MKTVTDQMEPVITVKFGEWNVLVEDSMANTLNLKQDQVVDAAMFSSILLMRKSQFDEEIRAGSSGPN